MYGTSWSEVGSETACPMRKVQNNSSSLISKRLMYPQQGDMWTWDMCIGFRVGGVGLKGLHLSFFGFDVCI